MLDLMSPLQRLIMRGPTTLYRARLGRLLTRRMLLLTHIGRKSGLQRRTVLEVVEVRGAEPVIVSGFGETADWFRNVRAHPEVTVDWAGDRFTAMARILDHGDAAQVFERYLTNRPKASAVISGRLGVPPDVEPSVVAERLPVLVLERSM